MNDAYQEKLRTVEEACALVNKKDSMGLPLGPGQPLEFLQKLGEVTQFEDLVIFAGLLSGPFPVLFQPGVHLMSGFFGPMERALRQAGSDIKFVPADFRRFETIAERLKPRIMATSVAPPDEEGRLSLSLHAGATFDEMERVGNDPDRLLIVEVNKNLPRTLGVPGEYDHSIPIEWADVIIESDDPVLSLPDPEPNEVDQDQLDQAEHPDQLDQPEYSDLRDQPGRLDQLDPLGCRLCGRARYGPEQEQTQSNIKIE